jgi:DNA sulfur modification protein DndC
MFEKERSSMHDSIQHTIDMLNEYGPKFKRWRIAWSMGKDSTAVVTLIAYLIQAGLVAAPVGGLEVMCADTRMELPPLWAAAQDIRDDLEERGIPVQVVMAPMEKRFLPYILGRGVPPPNNKTFRWCTRQIKIDPMKEALEGLSASKDDPILMLTGVRLGESAQRDARIALSCSSKGGTECGAAQFQAIADSTGGSGPKFYQAPGKNGLATLAPIIHWRICHVWEWLSGWAPKPEFGGWETMALANAYGGRDGDEAQEIGARTGCVGCPLAELDGALDAIIRIPQWAYLAPLKGLRAIYRWMRLPCNRLRKAEPEVLKSGKMAANGQRMGPLTMVARLRGLRRILGIQERINAVARATRRPQIDLLNSEEVAFIRTQIRANVWPDGWVGTEPLASVLLPGMTVVEDEDGGQHVEEQLLLSYRYRIMPRTSFSYQPKPTAKLAPYRHLFGVVPDREIARRAGVRHSVVWQMRQRAGVPAINHRESHHGN